MRWGILKKYIKGKHPTNLAELEANAIEGWNNISRETINKLVLSFRARLELVLLQRGDSIADLLRKGIHEEYGNQFVELDEDIPLLKNWFEERKPVDESLDSDIDYNTIEELCIVADIRQQFRPN
jgi:hypothetical protein